VFDPERPPSVPVPAATVILVREMGRGANVEVFLVRRHRRSQFMSDAFVFPGGKIDAGDGSPEMGAVRELFEEAGILLADGSPPSDLQAWRARLNAGLATFAELLGAARLQVDATRLCWWARWITPSLEPRRFDAQFFLAECPPAVEPTIDDKEIVEAVWLTPTEALARHAADTLRLPPPQVKTLTEMEPYPSLSEVRAAAARRQAHAHPIMPRFAKDADHPALLLPWDPAYQSEGVGEAAPMPKGHFLAGGPSRFVLEGMTWRLAYAPSSLLAD
jgi:8-oxo-dGTP pyrophosphatase MutT (NUDIX family)